jgi:hypothetical protein
MANSKLPVPSDSIHPAIGSVNPPGACSGPLAPAGGDSPARPSASAIAVGEAAEQICRQCGVRGFSGDRCPECETPVAEVAEGDDPIFGQIISSYSRAQALEDGALVDITATAREAGFTLPVAITRAAWSDCVEWSEADSRRSGGVQDQAGRLWDVVWMASRAVLRSGEDSQVSFKLFRVKRGTRGRGPTETNLTAQIGPGDDADPVITIMLPDED